MSAQVDLNLATSKLDELSKSSDEPNLLPPSLNPTHHLANTPPQGAKPHHYRPIDKSSSIKGSSSNQKSSPLNPLLLITIAATYLAYTTTTNHHFLQNPPPLPRRNQQDKGKIETKKKNQINTQNNTQATPPNPNNRIIQGNLHLTLQDLQQPWLAKIHVTADVFFGATKAKIQHGQVTIKGHLDLEEDFNGSQLPKSLPDNLIIEGDFDNFAGVALPKNLHVKGDCNLDNYAEPTLPEGMIIEGNFSFSSALKGVSFPKKMTVGKNFKAENIPITNIPNTCLQGVANDITFDRCQGLTGFEHFLTQLKANQKVYLLKQFVPRDAMHAIRKNCPYTFFIQFRQEDFCVSQALKSWYAEAGRGVFNAQKADQKLQKLFQCDYPDLKTFLFELNKTAEAQSSNERRNLAIRIADVMDFLLSCSNENGEVIKKAHDIMYYGIHSCEDGVALALHKLDSYRQIESIKFDDPQAEALLSEVAKKRYHEALLTDLVENAPQKKLARINKKRAQKNFHQYKKLPKNRQIDPVEAFLYLKMQLQKENYSFLSPTNKIEYDDSHGLDKEDEIELTAAFKARCQPHFYTEAKMRWPYWQKYQRYNKYQTFIKNVRKGQADGKVKKVITQKPDKITCAISTETWETDGQKTEFFLYDGRIFSETTLRISYIENNCDPYTKGPINLDLACQVIAQKEK